MKTKHQLIQITLLLIIARFGISTLKVWKPASLSNYFDENPIVYSIASFGRVPYGHSIIGKVVLADPISACEPLHKSETDPNKDGSLIVLVTRGGCPFAKKALHAQSIGARMVIYVDSTVEDVTKVLPTKDRDFTSDITIPSI